MRANGFEFVFTKFILNYIEFARHSHFKQKGIRYIYLTKKKKKNSPNLSDTIIVIKFDYHASRG